MEEKYGHFRREERDKRLEREATMWRGRGLHPLPLTPQICIMVTFMCKQTPRIRLGIIYFTFLWNKLCPFIASSISHMFRITTSPFTNAQPLVFFVFFWHSSRVFFLSCLYLWSWGCFEDLRRINLSWLLKNNLTSRRTNPIDEIVAAIVIPAGSNPGFLAPLAKILTTTRTLILSLINILKSNAWHSLLFLSLVWLPKFNYRIVQSMSHAFIDWCIDAKKLLFLLHCCIDATKLLFFV